ncbi:MAG: sensor histidine kinase [Bacteroidia bacterium]
MEINSKQIQFNKNVEINIFRISQEALTNIAKHSNASEVEVKVVDLDGHFSVSIKDNGVGMEPNMLKNPLSMGLINMKERSKLIDATLIIKSNPREGTHIELIVTSHG